MENIIEFEKFDKPKNCDYIYENFKHLHEVKLSEEKLKELYGSSSYVNVLMNEKLKELKLENYLYEDAIVIKDFKVKNIDYPYFKKNNVINNFTKFLCEVNIKNPEEYLYPIISLKRAISILEKRFKICIYLESYFEDDVIKKWSYRIKYINPENKTLNNIIDDFKYPAEYLAYYAAINYIFNNCQIKKNYKSNNEYN